MRLYILSTDGIIIVDLQRLYRSYGEIFMIDSFWVVHEGIPLFVSGKKATDSKSGSSELKTGFFSALHTFARSVENQDVMAIILTESKYVYHSADQLLFIAGVSLYDNEYLTKSLLEDVAKMFHKQFKEKIPSQNESMLIERNMFRSFEEPLQKHITKVNLVQLCANCKSYILSKYIETKNAKTGEIHRFCSSECEHLYTHPHPVAAHS